MFSIHLCLGLSNTFLLSDFMTKITRMLPIFTTLALCPAHFIPLTRGREYILQVLFMSLASSSCHFSSLNSSIPLSQHYLLNKYQITEAAEKELLNKVNH
jgi:hypothetical protein